MNKTIVAFISDHGFGHAARSSIVLKALLISGIEVVIVSAVPKWFFDDKFRGCPQSWSLIEEKVDVGLFQESAIKSDTPRTVDALSFFWQNIDAKAARVTAALSSYNPVLAYLDIPAFGVIIAQELGIPSVAFGNFSWDWIYDDLVVNDSENLSSQQRKELLHIKKTYQQLYGQVDLLLTLPYSGDFSAFTCQHVEVDWVGEKSLRARGDTLEILGLDLSKKYLLFSFGGHQFPSLNLEHWPADALFQPLIIGHELVQGQKLTMTNAFLQAKGVSYLDVIAASAVVVTKPGYGILTDCIFNRVPMIHLARGRFAEYPTLLTALDENLEHQYIELADLNYETLSQYATALTAVNTKGFAYSLKGAKQVSQLILEKITEIKA